MNEYKRLTKRDEFGNADIIGVDSCVLQSDLPFEEFNRVTNALNRFATLEEMILGGHLIILPCKVGDTIYCIRKDCDDTCQYYSCYGYDEMCDNEKYRKFIDVFPNISPCEKQPYIEESKFTIDFYFSCIGKKYMNITWFTDKAQAEARLKELKGE